VKSVVAQCSPAAICWGPVWMAARLVRPSTATADVGRAARRRLRVSPS